MIWKNVSVVRAAGPVLAAASAVLALGSGCAMLVHSQASEVSDPIVRGRVATDLNCKAKKLRVLQLEHAMVALGCGKFITYSAGGVKNHGPRSIKARPLPKRTIELLPKAEKDLACPQAEVEIRGTDSDYIATGCGKFAAYSEELELEKAPVSVDMTGLPSSACSEALAAPVQEPEAEVEYPAEVREYGVNGTQVFACVIEATGAVDRCQTVVGLEHGATETALATLAKRKFKPAMCGSKPIPALFVFDMHVSPQLEEGE